MSLVLSREQVRRVDALAVSRYQIPSVILMENAGANAAAAIDQRFGPMGKAVVFCGTGNNGGDGCVIARHLHNRGWRTRAIFAGSAESTTPDTSLNDRIIQAMGIERITLTDQESFAAAANAIQPDDVVIDALLGTGFRGEVRSPLRELIDVINAASKRAVVAIDIPSGLDCDAGDLATSIIKADLTVTFVALKPGLLTPTVRLFTGQIVVADIARSRELIMEVAGSSTT